MEVTQKDAVFLPDGKPTDIIPDSLKDKVYYEPVDQGLERQISERLKQIKEWKKKH